ncbi:MAG: UTP--glucose-1-phosphate uridylyltransferase [Deltaproteobacteria bacterium]|nr:UTP--glucose-1-phosphate uridylyltransferase [Deltaproteobacteria bacterium]
MVGLLEDPRIDQALLARYGFDAGRFSRYASEIARGTRDERSSLITAPIEPAPGVVEVSFEGPRAEEARALGTAALRAGEVAAVVLNGGMATRFGGVVKGVVEVDRGRSFIALKAEDARRAEERWGAPVPLVLMNSFATEAATREHLTRNHGFGLADHQLRSFNQTIALRLNPDGTLFIGDDGRPSYYAPGHGDFFGCIRRSGVLAELLDRGVRTITFSNVDNLGATIDPVIIGYHLLARAEMTAEVTAKRRTATGEWDKGGAPAQVAGRVQLVEGFRLPPELPPTFLPDFSTNNFLFDARAIDRDIPLEWHVVKKKVDDRPALQLESISCEASAALDERGQPLLRLGLLRVPREGERGRFFPIKEREDLDALRGAIIARLEASWRTPV